jgi:hypothetical protein
MTKTKTPFQIYVQRLKNHKENKVKNFHKEHKYRTIMKVPVRERERERERVAEQGCLLLLPMFLDLWLRHCGD